MSQVLQPSSSVNGVRWPQLVGFWLLGCLLLGLLHLVVPDHWRHANSIDYRPQVNSLLEGHGFLSAEGLLQDRYPPIYPIMLAAQFYVADHSELDRRDVHSTFAIATASFAGVLAFLCALQLVRGRYAAVAGLGVTLMPHLAYSTLEPLSLVPYTTCLLGIAYLMLRAFKTGQLEPRIWALIGLLVGILMLIRPIAILLPLVVLAIQQLAFRGSPLLARRRSAATLVAALILTLLPWEAWVYSQRGVLIPLSTGGSASLRDGISFDHKQFRTPMDFGPRLAELQRHTNVAYSDLNRKGEFRGFIMREFRRDPLAVAQLYALKGLRTWYGTDAHNPRMEFFGKLAAVVLLIPTLLSLAAVALHIRAERKRTPANPGSTSSIDLELWSANLILGLVIYHWAFATAFVSIVRYMVPALALLPVLWCVGLRSANRCRPRIDGTLDAADGFKLNKNDQRQRPDP